MRYQSTDSRSPSMKPDGLSTMPSVVVSAFSGRRLGKPPLKMVGGAVWARLNGLITDVKALAEARKRSAKLGARISRDWVARSRTARIGSQTRLAFQAVALKLLSLFARR